MSRTDGTGWVPINFDVIVGGSPIGGLPADPVNTIGDVTSVSSTDLVYRYACNSTTLTFEIDAQLESLTFTTGLTDRRRRDGGNNNAFYETGSSLRVLGISSDF